MGKRESHGCHAFRCRVNQSHRVLLPRLAGRLVPYAAPQVNYLFAPVIYAASCAHFAPPDEILGERFAHGLITAAYKAMYFDLMRNLNGRCVFSLLNPNVSCAGSRQTDDRFCQWTYFHFKSFSRATRTSS